MSYGRLSTNPRFGGEPVQGVSSRTDSSDESDTEAGVSSTRKSRQGTVTNSLGVVGTLTKNAIAEYDVLTNTQRLFRAGVFTWYFIIAAICMAVVFSVQTTTDGKEYNAERLMYVSVFGVSPAADGDYTFSGQTSQTGWVFGAVAFLAAIASVQFWRAPTVLLKLVATLGNSDTVNASENVVARSDGLGLPIDELNNITGTAYGAKTIIEVAGFIFLASAAGTREISLLCLLSAVIVLGNIFLYRSSNSKEASLFGLVVITMGFVFPVYPWLMGMIDTSYAYVKVRNNFAAGGEPFDGNEDFYRFYIAFMLFASSVVVVNVGMLSQRIDFGTIRLSKQQRDLSAIAKEKPDLRMKAFNTTASLVWLGLALAVAITAHTTDTFNRWATSTMTVGERGTHKVYCTAWDITWFIFSVATAQFLLNSWYVLNGMSTSPAAPQYIDEFASPIAFLDMLGPSAVHGAIYFVLASATGTTEFSELVTGMMIIWCANTIVFTATKVGGPDSEKHAYERKTVVTIVILLGLLPHGFAIAKAFVDPTLVFANAEGIATLRIALIAAAAFQFVTYSTRMRTPETLSAAYQHEKIHMTATLVIQAAFLFGIFYNDLLATHTSAALPCHVA